MRKTYLERKLEMLKEMRIRVTGDDMVKLKGFKTEISIDNYVRSMILREKEW